MPHVIEMYEDRTHAEVINFVHLQMQLHHPGGARTAEEGKFVIRVIRRICDSNTLSL